MITDFILGIFFAIAEGVVGLLPEMPAKPEVIDQAGMWLASLDWFVPVSEFFEFARDYLLPFVAILIVVRVVRVVRSG